MEKPLKKTLQQFAQTFQESKQRNINEADTVMYLTRFLTDVLGYDLFKDVTKEFQIRDRYCDLAIKINGEVKFLIEAKSMTLPLSDRHIEQAENYASRSGIHWVLLTNAISWQLYHLTFDTDGIQHTLAFETSLLPESDFEEVWKYLSLLSVRSITKGLLDEFWNHKKTLNPASLVRAVFTEEVLNMIRRTLHRKSDVRLELEDVANALRRMLNPEVLTEDIKIQKARKKRKIPIPSKASSQLLGEQVVKSDSIVSVEAIPCGELADAPSDSTESLKE